MVVTSMMAMTCSRRWSYAAEIGSASLGSRAAEALSILARALAGKVRAGGSQQGSVLTSRGKADDIAEPSSLPLWSLHRQPLSIARYVRTLSAQGFRYLVTW
jgi:hypothetical protein